MKRTIILLTALLCMGFATAQEPTPAYIRAILNTPPSLPEYVYCEISGFSGESRGIRIKFDFGQSQKDARKNNMITDATNNVIRFNSHMDGVNYMLFRGWEFVHSYSKGEDNDFTATILRMKTSKLTDEQRKILFEEAMKTGK